MTRIYIRISCVSFLSILFIKSQIYFPKKQNLKGLKYGRFDE